MDFVKASSAITAGVTLGDLADELGVTTVDLSRARTDPSNRYHRLPPDGWEAAIAKLARQQADRLTRVADRVDSMPKKKVGRKVATRSAVKKSSRKRTSKPASVKRSARRR
jgi:hypothetical protein